MALLPSIIIIITIITTMIHPTTTTTITAPEQPPPYNLSTLLSTLGFHDLSTATTTTPTTPTTIFAPTDNSLASCPYCSLPLLLLEHSVPALYPYHLLQTLTFGTKIQTLASTPTNTLCLTLTASNTSTLFIAGVEITRPDLFNDNSHFIIHGIQGYLTHLSPLSCQVERMTSLSFPPQLSAATPPSAAARGLLTDAMFHLRISQYTVLSLLIQQNLDLILKLNGTTVFAVNDGGVFGDGHAFVPNFRFHVVPNRRLTGLELIKLPVNSELQTMSAGEKLVVTVGGGGGPLTPMRINNVRVTSFNILCNDGIAVHEIAAPLPRVRRTTAGCWPVEMDGGPTALPGR
ncbi:uncharacterized protein LOC143545535 [Bidens hawaiensis]|uniref:uncharacterized protein LOC143545535 n=1 Tax=Bidens hawaiensis TaxID=980011 RepID=UPI00404A90F4